MEYDDDTSDDDYTPYTPAKQLIDKAVKSMPEFELREMLSLYKSEPLKDLARTYKMQKYGSAKKIEMINFLCNRLANHEFVESVLLHTNDKEFAFFESAAIDGGIELSVSEAAEKPYGLFKHLYFIEIYYTFKNIIFVVPDVIREIYSNLKNTPFPTTRKRYSMIHSFATSFASLYGVVDFDYFTGLCNERLQTEMDNTELSNILIGFTLMRNPCYCLYGDLLIHSKIDEHTIETDIDEYIVESSNDEVDRIESARGELSMKQLPLEEVLMYSSPGHFEHTPAHDRLIRFLEENNSDYTQYPDVLQYDLGRLNEAFMRNDDIVFKLKGIDLIMYEPDSETIKIYSELMRDVERHTRKWSRNGWMLAEIESPL